MFDKSNINPEAAPSATLAAPYDTLYADEALLAINKPPGLVVHPTYKHPDGTLTDAIFAWSEAIGASRPWLLHRLDKDTSGVTLFARTEEARRALARQFAQRMTHKRYLALTIWPDGLPLGGEVDAPLWRDPLDRRRVIITEEPPGQASRTRYRALARSAHPRSGVGMEAAGYALVLAEPVTGRTHQIRAHLTSLGAPLVGDAMYLPEGSPVATVAPRAMLHAWSLTIRWPLDGPPRTIIAPPPDDFLATARALGFALELDALDALTGGFGES
ncbi:MAG TPA: RluA family pseudouridine synthase [Ktedonobacterales bacterium]|nr:RluA family pseudouridine synthase [Ktedonobacterales bacterium]